MTKLLVVYPDAEALIIDHLKAVMSGCTVGIGVPANWKKGSTPRLEVAWDGTPSVVHPIAQRATVRLTARADTPAQAKQLVQEAHGHVLYGPWPDGISNVRSLTGPFPARDPQTLAELASVTVQVTVRSAPFDGS